MFIIRLTTILFIIIFLFLPFASLAANLGDITINEIAWMGTKFSSSDEWIELKNNTSQEIDLAGFGIYEKGGSELVVSLSGKIAAGSYYLIERSDDNTVSDVIADLVSPFGGSGLNNSGEYLVLKDSAGNIIDQLDFSAGWPAGGASPDYSSMERNVSGWHTNNGNTRNGIDGGNNPINGTPGRQNSLTGAASDDLSAGSAGNSSATGTEIVSATSSDFLSSAPIPQFSVEAGSNIIMAVGEEAVFSGSVSQNAGSLDFIWNFGDGNTAKGKAVKHKYKFPGKYIAVLSAGNGQTSVSDQIEVVVYPSGILISEFAPASIGTDGQWVEIQNNSSETVDLSGWQIDTADKEKKFNIPYRTFISAGGFLVFSADVMNMSIPKEGTIALSYPGGYAVHAVEFKIDEAGVSAARKPDGSFVWTGHKTPGGENIFVSGNDSVSANKKINNIVFSGDEKDIKTRKAALATIAKVNGGNETVRLFLPKPVFASVENDFSLSQKIFEEENNNMAASVIDSFKYWIIIPIIFIVFIYFLVKRRYA